MNRKMNQDRELEDLKKKKIKQDYDKKIESFKESWNLLRTNMEKLSFEEEEAIKKNPEFRTKFAKICNELDIDPLISFFKSKKKQMGNIQ